MRNLLRSVFGVRRRRSIGMMSRMGRRAYRRPTGVMSWMMSPRGRIFGIGSLLTMLGVGGYRRMRSRSQRSIGMRQQQQQMRDTTVPRDLGDIHV